MTFVSELTKELSGRMDCVQADYERLLIVGADKDALERIIKHSMEIGVIKDKLENMKMHDMLMEKGDK